MKNKIEKYFKSFNNKESRALVYVKRNDYLEPIFFKVVFPDSKNTATTTISDVDLNYFDNEVGMLSLYADFHSHHTMGTFFSSTDDHDEKNRHNIIFGVFSWKNNINKWLFRTWCKKTRDFKILKTFELPTQFILTKKGGNK